MSQSDNVSVTAGSPSREVTVGGGRASGPSGSRRPFPVWPLFLLALPAFVAIWSGWVGLGQMCGFGPVTLLPGIADWKLNTAITLPIGMETYAGFAIKTWLSRNVSDRARSFARWSTIVSLGVGSFGQVAYHLMAAAGWKAAPWPIVIVVSCLPVAVLGMGAALAHLIREDVPQEDAKESGSETSELDALLSGDLPEAPVSPAPAGRWEQIQMIRRENPGITQPEVARLLGVSDRTVRNAMPEGVRW